MAIKKTPAAAKARVTVAAHKHRDKRSNIPTEELRDFVADEELAPRKILYLRDPSLDPQLVWKGKDEQDRQPLEVPAVPIYIQEKIRRPSSKKSAPQPKRTRPSRPPSSPTSTASSSKTSLTSTTTSKTGPTASSSATPCSS